MKILTRVFKQIRKLTCRGIAPADLETEQQVFEQAAPSSDPRMVPLSDVPSSLPRLRALGVGGTAWPLANGDEGLSKEQLGRIVQVLLDEEVRPPLTEEEEVMAGALVIHSLLGGPGYYGAR